MQTVLRALLVAAVLGPAPGVAHHSASQYDFSTPVQLAGTITLVEVRNPHIRLILSVTDENGDRREIEFEGHSRNNVYRLGWRPGMMAAGESLTITIAPLRDGTDGGYITAFEMPDGTRF